MKDPRFTQMAEGLIKHSVKLKTGEKILIEVIDDGIFLAQAIVKAAHQIGAIPFVLVRNKVLLRELMLGASEEQLSKTAEYELAQMREMDAYIAIRGSQNINETADVPGKQQQMYLSHYQRPVFDERIANTKWCVMRYPNAAMAQSASMSTEAFEDFFFKVCALDYQKMNQAMQPLKKLMEATDQVRIVGPGTDLTFSIKGMPAVICSGEVNRPDGEIYTVPIRNSVNGKITYNTPAVYQGYTYEQIEFSFENGKIISAQANNTEKLNCILDTDEGARYIGEFALGLNPFILEPMKDTLFDEKIAGSLHFTPGKAYEDCDNGNRSAVHWDLVLIQRPEYGGGEIYFDNQLIRKDGIFVLPELEALNPASFNAQFV